MKIGSIKRLASALMMALCLSVSAYSADIRGYFTEMPDSLLFLLSRTNRLDLVDFYDYGMEAKVTNRLSGSTVLKELSADRLLLQYTEKSQVLMRLFWQKDSVAVICIVHTVQTGMQHSTVEFYDSSWQKIDSDELISVPYFDDYIKREYARNDTANMLRECCELQTVLILSPEKVDGLAFYFTGLDFLEDGESRYAHFLQPVVRHWNGKKFK